MVLFRFRLRVRRSRYRLQLHRFNWLQSSCLGHNGWFFGISYGPQIQVYYLIAFWLFICTVAMFAFTQTPLGRIINAVRDNPERAEFIGYDPQWVRYLTLMLSAFFAGISGGLTAINFEIVSAENVSALRSGLILLFTVIGGAGFFFGPMIGAIIGVFLTVMLSDFTSAWQLYFGVLFVLMVMYAPSGIAGLIMQIPGLIRSGKIRRVMPQLGLVLLTALLMTTGFVMLVEMLYHRTLRAADGSNMQLFGLLIDTEQASGWLVATLLIIIGLSGWIMARKRLIHAWNVVSTENPDDKRVRA